MQITEDFIIRFIGNSSTAANGKVLAQKGKFETLSITADETLLFGTCKGSGSAPYFCSVDFENPGKPVPRCTCPSRQIPCKHAAGLLFCNVLGKPFTLAETPEGIAELRAKAKQKEAKKTLQAENPAAQTKPEPAQGKPKPQSLKKCRTQLEGIELAEKLLQNIMRSGLHCIDLHAQKRYEDQVKELGNYFIDGIQAALTEVFQTAGAAQKDQDFSQAVEAVNYLHSLLKKSRTHTETKISALEILLKENSSKKDSSKAEKKSKEDSSKKDSSKKEDFSKAEKESKEDFSKKEDSSLEKKSKEDSSKAEDSSLEKKSKENFSKKEDSSLEKKYPGKIEKIEELMGYAWKLTELKDAGLLERDARLIQVGFSVIEDVSRKRFEDEGIWLSLANGEIYLTKHYRPFNALKQVREEDSFFPLLTVPELYVYPGDRNPRIRWEAAEQREITAEDWQDALSAGKRDFAEVIKAVKNQIKNPLADKHPVFALRIARLGSAEGNAAAVFDEQGTRIPLRLERFGHLLAQVSRKQAEGNALICRFQQDLNTNTLWASPIALIACENIIRFTY
ncbi:MAG: SWIM zinc finger family protein [Spirochaetaceae bacterium]|jgi:hypothetical protein|nr:SWIM zinc finger family protein [Spirochaetaceae bacterium]